MNPKLLEVLKKAKQVDQRAKSLDSKDISGLESKYGQNVSGDKLVSEQPMGMPPMGLPTSRPQSKVDVNSQAYRERVKESGLPPEIMKAMLDNPIEQPDAPGTFSMNEEAIREVNPNYGKQVTPKTTKTNIPKNVGSLNVDEGDIRKMIAEEISKALPSIIEKYFDKKMIQENINVLKSLKIKRKTNNNRA